MNPDDLPQIVSDCLACISVTACFKLSSVVFSNIFLSRILRSFWNLVRASSNIGLMAVAKELLELTAVVELFELATAVEPPEALRVALKPALAFVAVVELPLGMVVGVPALLDAILVFSESADQSTLVREKYSRKKGEERLRYGSKQIKRPGWGFYQQCNSSICQRALTISCWRLAKSASGGCALNCLLTGRLHGESNIPSARS